MIRSLYTAATGMEAQNVTIDTISNNLPTLTLRHLKDLELILMIFYTKH